MKKFIWHGVAILLCIIAFVNFIYNNKKIEEVEPKKIAAVQQSEKSNGYPINDLWVYRYNPQTNKSEFVPCGYLDEYTSAVEENDEELAKIITGSYMYLGTIKGYQNSDKTMRVFQVCLPELSDNFVLTNDNFKLDYSGDKKMIEVSGWIYMKGTTILAVSPLYED